MIFAFLKTDDFEVTFTVFKVWLLKSDVDIDMKSQEI